MAPSMAQPWCSPKPILTLKSGLTFYFIFSIWLYFKMCLYLLSFAMTFKKLKTDKSATLWFFSQT